MVAYNSPRKNSSGRVPPSLFRKFFVVLNFVILSFLWDGGADVYCRVTAKLLRGEDVKDGNDINEFLEKSTGKLNEQGHGVLHDEDDVHDHLHPTKHHGDRVGPGHHFDHPHNTRHKTPPTHHLEEHTHEVVHKPHPKKKDHFVQSYAAGPPPSDFWTGGTGKKVPSLDDLAPDPEELKNRPPCELS